MANYSDTFTAKATSARCNRCAAPIWFCTGWKSGKKYPVNVQQQADGTLLINRKDFHNCAQTPAQTPVAAAVTAPISPAAVISHDEVENFIRANREDLVLGLNALLTLDKPVFDNQQETRVIIPAADGTATSLPVPPSAAPIAKSVSKPAARPAAKPATRTQPLTTPAAASGSAIYKCVTEACAQNAVEFPGKLPSQTGNKPVTCAACGNTARFTRRAV